MFGTWLEAKPGGVRFTVRTDGESRGCPEEGPRARARPAPALPGPLLPAPLSWCEGKGFSRRDGDGGWRGLRKGAGCTAPGDPGPRELTLDCGSQIGCLLEPSRKPQVPISMLRRERGNRDLWVGSQGPEWRSQRTGKAGCCPRQGSIPIPAHAHANEAAPGPPGVSLTYHPQGPLTIF